MSNVVCMDTYRRLVTSVGLTPRQALAQGPLPSQTVDDAITLRESGMTPKLAISIATEKACE